MSEPKTPYEMWAELRDLVLALEKDAQKATRGMKAGGVRLRSLLQQVREHCVEMRRSVLEHRSTRRSRSDDPTASAELGLPAGDVGAASAKPHAGVRAPSEASQGTSWQASHETANHGGGNPVPRSA